MNSKQQKIYNDIFSNPVRSNIPWKEIESLFQSLGAKISEGNGSRIRVELNGERAVFLHTFSERRTYKRKFLSNAGVGL